MASPDAENLLAYIDLSELLELIDSDEHWRLFEDALLPRVRWRGFADELKELRHRSAHCRRPHGDDLARLELMLGNLESGARRALRTYGATEWPSEYPDDPVARSWIEREHPAARRLLDHAERNYETDFRLYYSVRPWCESQPPKLSRKPGVIYHAEFVMRDGRTLSSDGFWHDGYLTRDDYELIVHVARTDPWDIAVTFAAVDDPGAIADCIGRCFDSVLTESNPYPDENILRTWMDDRDELDFRFQVRTPIALARERTPFAVLAGLAEPYWRPA
jgi:hypothetical protein